MVRSGRCHYLGHRMGLLFRGMIWFGLPAAGLSATDRDDRMAELSRLLESHGRAIAEQDRAILEYLARQR